MAAISNLDALSLPSRQRLERAMSHAVSAFGAAGDVPHPDIADPRHAEVQPLHASTNHLKHLELLDQLAWSNVSLCPELIRHVPKH